MNTINKTVVALVTALAASTSMASAAKLTFYCSAQEDWCQSMARGFEEATGIDVNMTRKSSGETFARSRPKAQTPKVMSGGVVLVTRICRQPRKV